MEYRKMNGIEDIALPFRSLAHMALSAAAAAAAATDRSARTRFVELKIRVRRSSLVPLYISIIYTEEEVPHGWVADGAVSSSWLVAGSSAPSPAVVYCILVQFMLFSPMHTTLGTGRVHTLRLQIRRRLYVAVPSYHDMALTEQEQAGESTTTLPNQPVTNQRHKNTAKKTRNIGVKENRRKAMRRRRGQSHQPPATSQ
jgi:hypothetical protein